MRFTTVTRWCARFLALTGVLLSPWAHASSCKFLLSPVNPDSAYIVNSNGTVIDTRSNLMWQACSEGQVWNGSVCTGTASQLTWDQALAAGVASRFANFSDWRLPDVKELSSLVETCTDSPTINTTVFPSGLGSGYWSSSPTKQLNSTNVSWMINFQFGTTNKNGRISPAYARLVRNFSAQAQTITGPSFGGAFTVGTSTTASATASSGLAVTITSATPSICTVSGSTASGFTVTGVTAGTCTITASQSGNLYYSAATPTQANATVGKGSQTIGAITATSGGVTVTKFPIGGTATLSATASSGLAVAFGATPSNVCTISGNVVTGVGAGTCSLTANQAGDANYFAATQVNGSLAVLLTQTITFAGPSGLTAGQTLALSATTTASPSNSYPVTFNSTTPTQCSVTGSVAAGFSVNGLTAGTNNCSIVASQAGDNVYAPAPDVSRTVSVAQGTQTIGAITLTAPMSVGATVTASASASSGLPVSISAGPASVCTNNGNQVTGVAVGYCTLVASQAGNVNYQAAPTQTADFYVNKGVQSIGAITASNGTGVTTKVGIAGTVTLSATATSGLAVAFGAGPSSICTISGNTVTGVAAGTCNLTADQGGSANYLAAPQVAGALTVLTAQTITFGAPTLAVGQVVALTASTTATPGSSYPITFTTTTPAACAVAGNTTTGYTLSGVAAGTSNCSVTASQAGDATYAPATPVTQTISVAKGTQSVGPISFSTPSVAVGRTVTLFATPSVAGATVVFGAGPSGTCTISGNVVTGVAAGVCSVTADVAATANYLAAPQQTTNLNVLLPQTITFNAPTGSVTVAGTPVTLTATTNAGSPASYPISFFTTTPLACTVSGATVTGVAAGTNNCVVVARQDGDATYAPAPSVSVTLSVGKGAQTIGAVTFSPTAVPVGGTATVSATASSGLTVSFTSTTSAVCTVSGTTVTGVSAGTCSITASQAGDANYLAAAAVVQTVTTKTFASFSPITLTFSNQTLNTTSAAQTVTLTNNGPNPIAISAVSTTLSEYAETDNCSGTSLPPTTGTCTFSVTFTPTISGTRAGALRVTTDAPGSPHLITLSGSGVIAAPVCTLTAAPQRIPKSGGSSTLTASCPTATSYTWTGGTCAGQTGGTCTVTPTATTTYTVTGTNAGGTSPAATTTITVGSSLMPILMLLLD